jgi:hypothetical protein
MTDEEEEVYAKARYLVEHFDQIPAYLADDEQWDSAVAMAKDLLGFKEPIPPICKYCGSVAPYGDARNYWITKHMSRWHRWIWIWKHTWEEGR